MIIARQLSPARGGVITLTDGTFGPSLRPATKRAFERSLKLLVVDFSP